MASIVDQRGELSVYFSEKKGERIVSEQPRSFCILSSGGIPMKGMPHPVEYIYGEVPRGLVKDVENKQLYQVCMSMEGTSILVFWCDKWYTATHKRLCAFKSSWADKTTTFGESFAMGLAEAIGYPLQDIQDPEEFVNEMYDKFLDKSKKYIFMLPSRFEERIGTMPTAAWPKPVNILVMSGEKWEVLENEETFPGVVYPEINVRDIDDLLLKVATCNTNFYQGIYFRKRGCKQQTKIYNREYNKRVVIRGNTPNLKFRFMFLRSNVGSARFFTETYPEFNWIEFERTICDTCSDILELERGNSSIAQFDYTEFVTILTKKCMLPITYRNLLELTKTAPLVFYRTMNKRKAAIKKKEKEEEGFTKDEIAEINAAFEEAFEEAVVPDFEEEFTQEMLDQIDEMERKALDQIAGERVLAEEDKEDFTLAMIDRINALSI